MAILTGIRSAVAVTSSCAVIWKQPSPSTAHTMRSGRPTFAPIAAGTAKPIVPSPPELIQVFGCSKAQYCDAHIWCWPTPETRIVSAGVAARSRSITNWGFSVGRLRARPGSDLGQLRLGAVVGVGVLRLPARRSVAIHGASRRRSTGPRRRDGLDQRLDGEAAVGDDRRPRVGGPCRSRPCRCRRGRPSRSGRRPTTLPVTRSSKRLPSATSRSAFCMAVTAV